MRGIPCGTKVVLQCLSLLREASFQKFVEAGGIYSEFGKSRSEFQSQNRGIDRRRRRKRRWRQGEEVLYPGVHLCRRGEQTVIADARSSRDAIGYLALHHENGTRQQSRSTGGKELQQDVRGNVVRKISDYVDSFTLRYERSKVRLENVTFDDPHLWLIAKTKGKLRCERVVEFQRDQAAAAAREDFGNGAMARSDLDHDSLANIAESVDDGVAGSIVYKKILPEFWLLFHLHRVNWLRTLID